MSEPSADDTNAERLKALAHRVRALRDAKRLTQEEFARRAHISVSFASLLERGARSPSFETLFTIADALGVTVADLLREGVGQASEEPSHARLLEFAKKAHLSRGQVERFIAVGRAVFGVDEDDEVTAPRCAEPGCTRPVLAKSLCGPHYHRQRRAVVAQRQGPDVKEP